MIANRNERTAIPHRGLKMAGSMTSPIAFASALSTRPTSDALREVVAVATEQLQAAPRLGFVFFSRHHADSAPQIAHELAAALATPHVLGCNGEAIAGRARECEDEPAISLFLAALPDSQITTMHLEFHRTPEGSAIGGWPEQLAGPWSDEAFLIALGEPFSFPADVMLEQLNEDRPGTVVAGGMASGGHAPGTNRLICGDRVFSEGAVVAHVTGGVRLRTVVSQGCRPIGKPFVVTKAERNVVYQLGGRPALEQLRELFQTLPTHEQRLVNSGLHLGRVVSEYRDRFEQGDFLVRNVVGGDSNSGAIAIGDYIRTGQTVQFHVRDAESADAELRQLLAVVRDAPAAGPRGALLFTCNGRGTRLFPQPHHDAAAIQQTLGDIPLAGFFAQGEIGPIGGKNFLHGFTASVAVLE
jgi:small ligand-binding sensory domain FIST